MSYHIVRKLFWISCSMYLFCVRLWNRALSVSRTFHTLCLSSLRCHCHCSWSLLFSCSSPALLLLFSCLISPVPTFYLPPTAMFVMMSWVSFFIPPVSLLSCLGFFKLYYYCWNNIRWNTWLVMVYADLFICQWNFLIACQCCIVVAITRRT